MEKINQTVIEKPVMYVFKINIVMILSINLTLTLSLQERE
jgi:hypothetical protein